MNIRNILLACICITFAQSGRHKHRSRPSSSGSCNLATGLLGHDEVKSAKDVSLTPEGGSDAGRAFAEKLGEIACMGDRDACRKFLDEASGSQVIHDALIHLLTSYATSSQGQSDPRFEALRKVAKTPVFVHLPDGSQSIEFMTYHDLTNRIAEVIPKLEALGKELESLGEDLQAEAFMVILNENVDELRRAAAEAVDVVSYQHYLHDKNLSGFIKVVKEELKNYKKVKEKHVIRKCQAAGTTFRLCTKVLGALQKRMDERRKMHLLLGMTDEAQASRLCVYTSFVKDIADTSADG